MADIQIFKSRFVNFCASAHRFRNVNILRFCLSKLRSISRNIILAIRWRTLKYTNVSHTFCASSNRFRIKKIKKMLPSKSRPRSRSAIFAVIHRWHGFCHREYFRSSAVKWVVTVWHWTSFDRVYLANLQDISFGQGLVRLSVSVFELFSLAQVVIWRKLKMQKITLIDF